MRKMVFAIRDLTLELTQTCFQDCLCCSSNSSPKDNDHLPFEVVRRVLDDFSSLGGKVVELSGGEPLSYARLGETIEFALEKKLQLHLFTSASVPAKPIDFNRLDEVHRIYVNLQAPNSVLHDYLVQSPGSFNRIMAFISECKKRGKWVGTHFIPLGYNIDLIDEYVELAERLRLDNVSLLRFVSQGRGKGILPLNNDEILHLFAVIERRRNAKSSLELKVGCPLDFGFIYRRSHLSVPCAAARTRCVVRPNGNVIPCPAFKDSIEFVGGNVKCTSFKTIWLKSRVFKIIRDFDHNKLQGLCKDCSFLHICRGRCHAQRYSLHGDLYAGPDPYCPLRLSNLQNG
jgi:radical SAM protein with 4Fe4S-binding SPASM domain